MRKTRKCKMAAPMLIALASAGLAGDASADVKIGFIGTLSGPAASLGQDQLDGFQLALDQRGGRLGGQQIQLFTQDDQLKPDVSVQEAQRLVESDKVEIITGVTFSNVMMAVAKPVTDAGVFLVGSNAAPTSLASEGCMPYLFSVASANDEAPAASGQLANELGYKSLYVMAPNYEAGHDVIDGLKKSYKNKIIDVVYTQVGQPDYSAEIAQVQAAKPDAVYVFYPGGMGVNFVKQYRQAGLLGKIPLLSVWTIDGSTLPALKDTAVGAITTAVYSPDLSNQQNTEFVVAFKKKYGRTPTLYAAQSYDAALLLDSAITRVKGNLSDKAAFRTALKAADFKSVRGSFAFGKNQFAATDFYRVDVVRASSGPELRTIGKIAARNTGETASECKMKD